MICVENVGASDDIRIDVIPPNGYCSSWWWNDDNKRWGSRG